LRLALLSAAAVCLVSGAPERLGAPSQLPAVDAAPAFDARQISATLRSANPRLSERERRRIARAILANSERYGLDPELVTAVMIVESDVRPWVRSPKGAIGLMQVMPHWAVSLDLAGDLTRIESNVEIGCLILADNIRRLGERDGISAYFWGSRIRGVAYVERVLEMRAQVRRLSES
jgi:soluble lytic murein transglycosylase-like protein